MSLSNSQLKFVKFVIKTLEVNFYDQDLIGWTETQEFNGKHIRDTVCNVCSRLRFLLEDPGWVPIESDRKILNCILKLKMILCYKLAI